MAVMSQQGKEELIRDAVVAYIEEVAEDRTIEELVGDLKQLIAGLDECCTPPNVPPHPSLEG